MDMRTNRFAGVTLALLLLAGCGVSGLDGIMGGGQSDKTMNDELRGTIDRIDLQDQFFVLTQTDRATSSLVNRDDSTRIYFDDHTTITYKGQTYRPEDLEEGDQVAVRVSRSGDRLFATSMTVLRDVSSSSGMQSGTRTTQLQGTVQDVNPAGRTIDIDPGLARSSVTVPFDANLHTGTANAPLCNH
jgi:hypothetical protein